MTLMLRIPKISIWCFLRVKIVLPTRCVLQMHFQTWPNCLTFHKWNAALGAVQPKSWMNTFAKKPTVLTTYISFKPEYKICSTYRWRNIECTPLRNFNIKTKRLESNPIVLEVRSAGLKHVFYMLRSLYIQYTLSRFRQRNGISKLFIFEKLYGRLLIGEKDSFKKFAYYT